MTNEQIKEHLLSAGVKNLKEFGYPDADTKIIITDFVLAGFFKSMLEDNRGNGKQVDEVIDELLKEIKEKGGYKMNQKLFNIISWLLAGLVLFLIVYGLKAMFAFLNANLHQ